MILLFFQCLLLSAVLNLLVWFNACLIPSFCTFIHSFILDIYIAPLQEAYSEALSVQLWSKRNKKLAERRHVVPRQQAQCKRELILSGGANNRESSTLFKHRAGPRNQELTTSRRTKGSAGSWI